MKKILYISSNDTEYFNGGAIGTKKIIEVMVPPLKIGIVPTF